LLVIDFSFFIGWRNITVITWWKVINTCWENNRKAS